MTEYIDIHSHILPGLDDGAIDEAQTLRMLRTAYAQGVRIICATPHFRPAMFKVSISLRQEAFNRVRQMAEDISSDFEIILGNELYYSEDSIKYLNAGQCKCIGDTRYVLVEFGKSTEFDSMRRSITRLITEGYIPILAHIERYGSLRCSIEKVEELVDMGGYIQVNSSSVVNSSFMIKNFIKRLLKYDLVHFIASDSHNDTSRGYNFTESVLYIEKKYGEECVKRLMYTNPLKMLNDEYI